MCTLALYLQEFENVPLLVAANRDERLARPAAPPALIHHETPRVFGGKDLLAGGTWLGVNERGVVAAILNRRTEGERPAARSRGLLCLDLLSAGSLAAARALLEKENGSDYRPFNLLLAGAGEALAAYNVGAGIETVELDRGLHVLSNTGLFDPRSEKLERAHKLFSGAREALRTRLDPPPEGRGEPAPAFVRLLREILSDHTLTGGAGESKRAICVHAGDYGTVSSSIVMLERGQRSFRFYHAPAAPCRSEYEASPLFELS